jgi:hypothetical protein
MLDSFVAVDVSEVGAKEMCLSDCLFWSSFLSLSGCHSI